MRRNTLSSFVQLIWEIVEDPRSAHIITWTPNGTSFCILDQQKFSRQILSKHFKHENISSFVRQVNIQVIQLNMYNFHKNKNNTNQLEFSHKLFRRDAKQILIGIKRKPSETDHIEGEQLLKEFLCKKYDQHFTHKLSQQFQQDKGSQNTAIDSFYKKQKTVFQSQKLTTRNNQDSLIPRIVLNIILINKSQDY